MCVCVCTHLFVYWIADNLNYIQPMSPRTAQKGFGVSSCPVLENASSTYLPEGISPLMKDVTKPCWCKPTSIGKTLLL